MKGEISDLGFRISNFVALDLIDHFAKGLR